MKIISGGQTGIDRMGLEVARELGLATGGTAPKNYWTEDGPDLSLKDFGLVEDVIRGYLPRTIKNICNSDVTVLYGDMKSPGSNQTINFCKKYSKPYITNPDPYRLVSFLKENNPKIINVAGNRASKIKPLTLEWLRSEFKSGLLGYILLINKNHGKF